MKKTTKTPTKKPAVKAKKPAPKATKPKAKAKPAKPPVVVKTGGKPVVVPSVAKVTQNGVSRPRATFGDGTPKKTARVWQIADELSAKNAAKAKASKTEAQPPTRQEILEACQKEKITVAVCYNQFYRWRKFNGLFGRQKLDGTVAAVTGGPKRGAQAVKKPEPKAKPAKVVKAAASPAKKPAPKAKTPAKPKASKPAAPKSAKPAVKPPLVATVSTAPGDLPNGAPAPLPFPVAAAAASV